MAEERLKECWDEVRNCIHSLMPAALIRGNLVSALGRHVAALSDAGHPAACFEVCGTPYPLAPAIELQLLRIAQEAVTNAMRHSGATRIAIELSFDADAVRLTVSDNGAGFQVRRGGGGMGLGGMRERAAAPVASCPSTATSAAEPKSASASPAKPPRNSRSLLRNSRWQTSRSVKRECVTFQFTRSGSRAARLPSDSKLFSKP